jgi:hypothetical protein
MSCCGKAMPAWGECECYFKPRDFAELLDNERQWFALLDTLRHVHWRALKGRRLS